MKFGLSVATLLVAIAGSVNAVGEWGQVRFPFDGSFAIMTEFRFVSVQEAVAEPRVDAYSRESDRFLTGPQLATLD